MVRFLRLRPRRLWSRLVVAGLLTGAAGIVVGVAGLVPASAAVLGAFEAAVRKCKGIKSCHLMAGQYDYMMYTDGDNQYDVREFAPYLHLLRTADVLSGYVTQKAASTRRKVQSLVYNVLITALFFVRCRDIDCAMKVYSRKAIASNSLRSTSCFIDAEMIIKSKRAGFKVAQFPVTHFPRTEGLASGSKFTVIAATVRDMVMFRLGLL